MASLDFITFQKTIGTSATQLVTNTELAAGDTRTPTSVIVSGIKANTGLVYLGNSNSVTSGTGAPEIEAGDTIGVDFVNVRKLWAIGTNVSDKVAVAIFFR